MVTLWVNFELGWLWFGLTFGWVGMTLGWVNFGLIFEMVDFGFGLFVWFSDTHWSLPVWPSYKSLSDFEANLLCSFHLGPPIPIPNPLGSPAEYKSSNVLLYGRPVVSSKAVNSFISSKPPISTATWLPKQMRITGPYFCIKLWNASSGDLSMVSNDFLRFVISNGKPNGEPKNC